MEEPGEFDIKEVDLPEIGPNDVLMRVEANGVCGTDIHIAEGGMDLDFPILPGHEFVGFVEEKGERVETEGWIDSSNVALYSEERDGPVRTGHQFVGDGGELYDTKKEAVESFDGQVPSPIQKVRVSKQTDEVFDEM